MKQLRRLIFWEALYQKTYMLREGLADTVENRRKFLQYNLGVNTGANGNACCFMNAYYGTLYNDPRWIMNEDGELYFDEE